VWLIGLGQILTIALLLFVWNFRLLRRRLIKKMIPLVSRLHRAGRSFPKQWEIVTFVVAAILVAWQCILYKRAPEYAEAWVVFTGALLLIVVLIYVSERKEWAD
jgi:hypothetical protein